jgi:hypothetical protein
MSFSSVPFYVAHFATALFPLRESAEATLRDMSVGKLG